MNKSRERERRPDAKQKEEKWSDNKKNGAVDQEADQASCCIRGLGFLRSCEEAMKGTRKMHASGAAGCYHTYVYLDRLMHLVALAAPSLPGRWMVIFTAPACSRIGTRGGEIKKKTRGQRA